MNVFVGFFLKIIKLVSKIEIGIQQINTLPKGKPTLKQLRMIKLKDKEYTCPIDVSLSFVSGKWKILILSHLDRFEKKGFSEIKGNLPGISEKMLSQQLKQLEKDRLIGKSVLSLKPYRVEYTLTETGKSFSPLFSFLSIWGIEFLKKNGIDYLKDQKLYK